MYDQRQTELFNAPRCWIEHGSYEKYSSKLFTEVLPVCVAESFYYQLNEQSTFSDDCTRNSDGRDSADL